MKGRLAIPGSLAIVAVGLALACLFFGYEPIGADPDVMYRPIKSVLAQSLHDGTLPFWSDRFGLGVPLVAESHAAAFYPPNWILYRFFSVGFAFRLSIWLHTIATAATTYLYARELRVSPWGSALASVSFALCGFQAIHSGHEPLYVALPYLPLCLLFADRYATTGRFAWLAGLALGWGVQVTAGHFQIPMWTAGLAIVCGSWRIFVEKHPRARGIGLVVAVLCGAGIAAVQLGLTWELTKVAGFSRSFEQLSMFAFPPSHWIQPAAPSLFVETYGANGDRYWGSLGTSAGESSFYFGTIPLIFAIIGLFADRKLSTLSVWKGLIFTSLMLASMPRWWPFGYWLATLIPGLGWFRCPGRYTLIASLGLALLAGRGFDHAISSSRFRLGMVLAVLIGIASLAWGAFLLREPSFRACMGESSIPLRFGIAIGTWVMAAGTIVLWRKRWLAPWSLVALTALELAALYHLGPVTWGWTIPDPNDSPILRRLRDEADVGLIASPLKNLPVRAGLTTAFPYLGITPPPPNYLLEASTTPAGSNDRGSRIWMNRFGVTHGIWHENDVIPNSTLIFTSSDPVLDRILLPNDPSKAHPRWKIVAYREASPPAWVSRSAFLANGWEDLYPRLVQSVNRDVAFYVREDAPAAPQSPWARQAKVVGWDGRIAIVEHAGACDLIISRTFYPGWTARVNDGPSQAVRKANGGLQAIRLDGVGTSRVTFSYEPTHLRSGVIVSLASIALALTVILGSSRHRPD